MKKTPYTRIVGERFQYYAEDCDCGLCANYRGKRGGCALAVCCCAAEKADALAHGRLKREKGWFGRWELA